jgi:hypothetical protein
MAVGGGVATRKTANAEMITVKALNTFIGGMLVSK